MQSIGEALKNAREQKGITLEQAEEDTKIRKRYLQALEDGEYAVIPGGVYAKGFLRNYANYLGLNQEEILIEYKLLNTPVRENGARADIQEVISKRRTSNRINRRAYFVTIAVAAVALLTFAVYSLIFGGIRENKDANKKGPVQTEKTGQTAKNQNQGTAKPAPDSSGSRQDKTNQSEKPGNSVNSQEGNGENGTEGRSPSVSINEPEDETPNEAKQVKVLLQGKNRASWAKVYVDGRVVFTGEIKPGDVKSFTGNTGVKFRLGNAGGVEVSVNGQDLGTLGGSGQVVDKEYLNE